MEQQLNPKPRRKLYIILGFSIICFLLILFIGGGIYLLSRTNNSKQTNTGNDSQNELNTHDNNTNTCTYEGTEYQDGESFDQNDGCQKCSCSGGKVTCSEKEIMATYTNELFPDLSFEYNSCEWETSEIDENVTSGRYYIKVNNTNSDIYLLVETYECPMGGGYPYCSNETYHVVNENLARFVSKPEYMEKVLINPITYTYLTEFSEKGTEGYDEYLEILSDDITNGSNICYRTNLTLTTKSTITENNCSDIYIYLSAESQQTIDELGMDADEIVTSIKTK